jgi:tetrahydromethanopterin S-methyltransferase subunit B
MSMNEDAMFKALLKNKPQQPKTSHTPIANEVQSVVAKPSFSKNSEETQTLQKIQARQDPIRAPAPEPVHKIEERVTQVSEEVTPTINPIQNTDASESIKKLASSMNIAYGLLKTAVIVLVLILIVGIAILIKLKP